jgi:hypothetical protein
MSEAEFDRLLDAVSEAIAPSPYQDLLAFHPDFAEQPQAANDNELEWPLLPFPEGWYAAS